jgi:hypothetical protein
VGQIPDSAWVSNAVQVQSLVVTLWTVYLGIVAAAVALAASDRPWLRNRVARLCAIAGYAAVAGLNLWAMLNARAQHDLMVNLIKDPALNQLRQALLKPRPAVYEAMHLSVDVGVILMMWFLPRREAVAKKAEA